MRVDIEDLDSAFGPLLLVCVLGLLCALAVLTCALASWSQSARNDAMERHKTEAPTQARPPARPL